jgi:hypothetical protein
VSEAGIGTRVLSLSDVIWAALVVFEKAEGRLTAAVGGHCGLEISSALLLVGRRATRFSPMRGGVDVLVIFRTSAMLKLYQGD